MSRLSSARLMHVRFFTDHITEIGQVYSHIRAWYDVAIQHHILSVEDCLEDDQACTTGYPE